MNNTSNYQQESIISIKICAVGDKKVGKTSFIQSYTQTPRQLSSNTHSNKAAYHPTVFDFSFSTIKLPISIPTNQTKNRSKYTTASSSSSPATPPLQNSKEAIFNLNFSDCSSLDCYTPLRFLSYDQCDIFFVCFRLDKIQTFYNAIGKWCPEVKHFCIGDQSSRSRIVLLGLGRQEMTINNHNNNEESVTPQADTIQCNDEDNIFFGQESGSRSSTTLGSSHSSDQLINEEMVDIEEEESSPKRNGRNSLSSCINTTRPRSKTYSYRRNYSNPFMKRNRNPAALSQLHDVVLVDSMLDSCLSLSDFDGEREVSWDMIEDGRRQLDELGVEHVYYECPFNNQTSVQFIMEECVREFYKCKLSQNNNANSSSTSSPSVSLLEKLKRLSL